MLCGPIKCCPFAALLKAGVSEIASVGHVFLKFEIAERKESAKAHQCQKTIADGACSKAPCAFFHAKAHAPPAGARHFIAAGAIHCVKYQRQQGKEVDVNQGIQGKYSLRRLQIDRVAQTQKEEQHLHDAQINREGHNRDEKPEKLLKACARVFKCVAIADCGGPDIFADARFAPEAVNTECHKCEKSYAYREREKFSSRAAILAINLP